jgi:hypothetical protein
MALAQLANLIGGGGLSYQGAYQNAQGQWVQDVTSNEGVTTQQNLQDQLTSDQWAQFQNELKQGYISPNAATGQSGLTVNTSLLPKVLGQYGINPNASNAGFGFTSAGIDSSSKPTAYGGRDFLNQSAVQWDPNYGWVTQQTNLKSDDDWFNKLGGMIGDVAPVAIMAAMGAGFGALNPGMLGNLLGSIPKIASGFDQGGNQGGLSAALPQIMNVLRNW